MILPTLVFLAFAAQFLLILYLKTQRATLRKAEDKLKTAEARLVDETEKLRVKGECWAVADATVAEQNATIADLKAQLEAKNTATVRKPALKRASTWAEYEQMRRDAEAKENAK